mmetsp:Transcript_1280/g.3773  ORF Transcript_1280/g.3773 Transcript_1280/m.3773 type:complete len:287 (-) Transcript_1280:361-1221(-)
MESPSSEEHCPRHAASELGKGRSLHRQRTQFYHRHPSLKSALWNVHETTNKVVSSKQMPQAFWEALYKRLRLDQSRSSSKLLDIKHYSFSYDRIRGVLFEAVVRGESFSFALPASEAENPCHCSGKSRPNQFHRVYRTQADWLARDSPSMTLPLQRFAGHCRQVPSLLSKGLTRSRSFSRNEGFVTILSNTPSLSPFRLRMVRMYSVLASDTIMQRSLSMPLVSRRAPASLAFTMMLPSSFLRSWTEMPLFQRMARHSSTACVKPTKRVLSRRVSRTSDPSLSKTK